MATLGGVDLGHIQSEEQAKDTSLFSQPLPTSNSDTTILLDIFGTTRNLTVNGVKTGTAAQLNTFVVAIEAFANGNQISRTFVSSLSTFANKSVFIKNFRWNYVQGSPSKLSYSLELIEGAVVT